MKLLDKIKNMFTEEIEEDEDEVKVEQIKNDVTHVSIESPNVEVNDDVDDEIVEKFSTSLKEPKPVFFNDDDFKDLNLFDDDKKEVKEEKKEEPKPEKEIYNSRIDELELYGSRVREEKKPKEEKKVFKPTPIISPVYGILDKNYHKEDIVSRDEVEAMRVNEESPIDTIRNKAYGTLEDELENTLFGSNSILFKKEDDNKDDVEIKEVDDDILTDLTDDISKELDELLVRKEKYIDDPVEEESKHEEKIEKKEEKIESTEDEDLLGFIDSTLYKDGDE